MSLIPGRHSILFILIALAIPATQVRADVLITEIAWMGDARAYTNEWLELTNTGSADISLDEWLLAAADGSPKIELAGSIAAGESITLERTDDDSAPSVAAHQIYTGALGNSGEVLRLIEAGGAETDVVDGTDGWKSIGGDSKTYETAQRTAGGWKTAAPTPGVYNGAVVSSQESTDESESIGSVAGSDVQEPGDPFESTTIHVRITAPEHVVVGADARFSADALGFVDEPLEGARYQWAFGNGAVGNGKETTYVYPYPGVYRVVAIAASGEWSGRDTMVVTAEPSPVRIADVRPGYLELENEGFRELNLSGWHLVRGSKRFAIPEATFMLPGARIRFASSTTTLPPHWPVRLLYPNGTTAATYTPSAAPQESAPASNSSPRTPSHPRRESAPSQPPPETGEGESTHEIQKSERGNEDPEVLAAAARGGSNTPFLLGLAGLLVLAAASVILIRPRRRAPDEYVDF